MYTTDLEFIREQHPFNSLSDYELDEIAKTVTTETIRTGGLILSQGGAPSDYLYIIKEGAIQLVRDNKLYQVLEEGEYFGYPSIITRNPPTSDVVAEEHTILYRIPKNAFHNLTENGQFSEYFHKNLGERLRLITSHPTTTIGGELTAPVGNLIVRPPVQVSPAATVAEAAKTMRRAWVDVVLVADNPPGIVTDHDFSSKSVGRRSGAKHSSATDNDPSAPNSTDRDPRTWGAIIYAGRKYPPPTGDRRRQNYRYCHRHRLIAPSNQKPSLYDAPTRNP